MPDTLRGVALVFASLLAVGCSMPPPKPLPQAQVSTGQGVYSAVAREQGAVRWLNIPFAEPPVGPLRWRAPQPPSQLANAPGLPSAEVMCLQMPGPNSNTSGDRPVGSEDCLYMDITAPRDFQSRQYPVMFWIHGGGNTTGYKGTYDFSPLVERQDVVVVTFNYRLGPLGWITHPALQDQAEGLDATSNFGTLDILAALQWTRDNIAAFGGDADNITVFGESAGGHNVYQLLASPLSEGMFHKAIVQSGYTESVSRREAINRNREFPQMDRGSWELLGALGLSQESVSGEALKAVSGRRIIETYFGLEKDHVAPLTTADGIVIPEHGLAVALGARENNKGVPVLAGSNRDEITLWVGLDRYFVNAEPVLMGLLPDKLSVRDEALFDYWVDMRSRAWKARGVDAPLTSLQRAGNHNLYAYRFDWDEQDDSYFLPFSQLLGASHASEIAFVMGGPMYGPIGNYMYPDTPSAREMTDVLMEAWANFARTGEPGDVRGDPWPPYVIQAPHTMVLDSGDGGAVEANRLSLDTLLQEVTGATLLSDLERCLLVWDMVTNIGQPDYSRYTRWNNGECANVDARSEKSAIHADLVARFGSATLP